MLTPKLIILAIKSVLPTRLKGKGYKCSWVWSEYILQLFIHRSAYLLTTYCIAKPPAFGLLLDYSCPHTFKIHLIHAYPNIQWSASQVVIVSKTNSAWVVVKKLDYCRVVGNRNSIQAEISFQSYKVSYHMSVGGHIDIRPTGN